MSKAREIELLRECAENLGTASYCGPWLTAIIPSIEADIGNDFAVAPQFATPSQAAEEAARIVAHAKEEAQILVLDAQRKADTILAEARCAADSAKAKVEEACATAIRSLR